VTRLRLSEDAEADLRQIFWQGLEMFGARQTETYLSGLEDQLQQLLLFPDTGRLHTAVQPPVRVQPYGAHVIIYEHIDDIVAVLRIRSAREDWTTSPLGSDWP
jgi:toxin ParE1/3/4